MPTRFSQHIEQSPSQDLIAKQYLTISAEIPAEPDKLAQDNCQSQQTRDRGKETPGLAKLPTYRDKKLKRGQYPTCIMGLYCLFQAIYYFYFKP